MNAKKETGLVTYELKKLPPAEDKVHSAEQEFAESFYHIGKALGEIKSNELWRELPECRSWAHYCRLGRLDYQVSQADLYIKAAQVRPLLVDLPTLNSPAGAGEWSLKAVEQLCRLPLDSDIKRASKKIATRVKRGDRLSRALAKEIVDAELGVQAVKTKRQKMALVSASTPAEVLLLMIAAIQDEKESLQRMEETFWTDAEEQTPGIVKRLTREVASFASFLRSRP